MKSAQTTENTGPNPRLTGLESPAQPTADLPSKRSESDWSRELSQAIRDPAVLINRLGLDESLVAAAQKASQKFPLFVTRSFLDRMVYGDQNDPLLSQVLPIGDEEIAAPGFVADAVDDSSARRADGLLQKYSGRALMIATGTCAIHCRYCFRREYPYQQEPRRLNEWDAALDVLRNDSSIHEIILSGGDPLMLTDVRLLDLIHQLNEIPHLNRLRIHSRLPIVLPARMTESLLTSLTELRMTTIFVVHANHANEIVGDCADMLRLMVRSGLTVLNQAVLLRGVNSTTEGQIELCERLVDLGVLPYYLHQLDRVRGTAHFEVDDATAREIIAGVRAKLPGYAVPQLVREIPGELSKTPL